MANGPRIIFRLADLIGVSGADDNSSDIFVSFGEKGRVCRFTRSAPPVEAPFIKVSFYKTSAPKFAGDIVFLTETSPDNPVGDMVSRYGLIRKFAGVISETGDQTVSCLVGRDGIMVFYCR